MDKIYPITTFDNVIDIDNNTSLKQTIANYNHLNIGSHNNNASARLSIPKVQRKTGLMITYTINNTIYTDVYVSTKEHINDKDFELDKYWVNITKLQIV